MEMGENTAFGGRFSLRVRSMAATVLVALLLTTGMTILKEAVAPATAHAGVADGNKCTEAARIVWANRYNPWPTKYVVMAGGMAAACGFHIGTVWSHRAQRAWNVCWPNCPAWYAFKFW